ncbi:gliding motility-associated ABC transporter permease subunit GldF [Psychroflexus sp. YR1-1]|uniref:Gliding motility-associated ABC transporter permease subunit GldF n=1 Tax=Psychroflexus aurantiacus TaxID=2709310 RepID=A0A6B3QYN5_9FLAO|nr:gliding motility-associated ABC transporter permease subunit GldF [Psychroflexus aurantiacus]NEV93259.1 gliding motility-associated ABC transporter permease subunit GldF [Psychroflexus aurantiacus]
MLAIFSKEFNSFFSTPIGFIVVGLFLISTGSLIWIIPGNFNILNSGYVNLIPFFEALPWVFVFLIPAICMRSFSEEKKQGTLELLLTKPLSLNQLILGKFLGCLALSLIAILPTLFYLISLTELAAEGVVVDYGVIFSSYLGVVLFISCFTSIGIFASSLSHNQIIAFISGTLISLFLYFGFEGFSAVAVGDSELYTLDYFGMRYHYNSITRGILDSRNLIYFLSITFIFLALTRYHLKPTSE